MTEIFTRDSDGSKYEVDLHSFRPHDCPVYVLNKIKDKPQPKIVDLTYMLDRDVLMEFSFDTEIWELGTLKLVLANSDLSFTYGNQIDHHFGYCRFSTRWQPWFGDGECSLPEGVRVEIFCRDGDTYIDRPEKWKRWNWYRAKRDNTDIIAYRVKGLMEDWKYPWEAEDNG